MEQTLTPEDIEIVDLGETVVELKEELLRNRMFNETVALIEKNQEKSSPSICEGILLP